MREILFRGKRKDNGEWVEGADVMHKTVRGELCLANVGKDWVKVDPLTFGQCTELTDSNGNKIFEGDIVKLTDDCNDFEWKAVVVFGNPGGAYCWGWNFLPIDGYKGTTDILMWVEMEATGAYCEVIGNIYDNPELLEGRKAVLIWERIMTERERLIGLLNQNRGCVEEQPAEELADYLLENGVIVLPCKVGDTVYEVVGKCEFGKYDDCVFRGGHGYSRCYDEGKVGNRCNAYIEEIKFTLPLVDYIGERVFPTLEEAEKALEKLR